MLTLFLSKSDYTAQLDFIIAIKIQGKVKPSNIS